MSTAWTTPFRSIGDSRTYVLAPNGSFTGAAAPGCQLSGGARLATDWRISPDVDLKPDLGGSIPGARHVALRFTAVEPGADGHSSALGTELRGLEELG